MLKKILMPSGGQTTDEMLIARWHKAVGDAVHKGDVLFDIETDKALLEIESHAEGILLQIRYQEGELVNSGEIVAYIGDVNEKLPEEVDGSISEKWKEEKVSPHFEDQPPATIAAQDNHALAMHQENGNIKSHFQKNDNKVYASPLAKSMARNENIRLEDVAQFVSKNLLRKNDIAQYIESLKTATEADFYFIDTTSMRKTIARRMHESRAVAPHYTISIDIDMTEVMKLRKKLNDYFKKEGIKVSYNDILMKVAAKAIETYPFINSTYQGEQIKVYHDVNVGLAVGLDTGLIVPVVKQVNKKSLSAIAKANLNNIDKAKHNRLQEADINGGTITLSNLGMFGIKEFTAILNQPESCILAIGGIMEKTVVINRKIKIRDMVNITGSFDHRVIDGSLGAAFLKKIKELFENPHLLLA